MVKKSGVTASSARSTRDIYEQDKSPVPERKVNLTTTIILCAVMLTVGLLVGTNWDSISGKMNAYLGGKQVSSLDLSSLNDLYEELSLNFDGALDKQKLLEGAKHGLVEGAGDPYTYYMTAEEATEFNKELEGDIGAGIGVEIGQRDGFVKVLRTTPDNPARKAGVLAGDIIYKADGEDISGLGVEDIAKKLRGEAGSKVHLTVVRNNEEVEFDLIRETINNVSVYSDYKDNTAIITITRFDQDTGTLARKEAEKALQKKVKKVIIDLRNNGGGYVTAAREVASLWIDGKVVLRQKSSTSRKVDETFATRGQAILANTKTIVLTNGSTASASEIVVGALKDYGLATVVGEKTYGKGSVQALENLKHGEMLRVTVAKWYTPNDVNINENGIMPDIEVERSFEQINKEIDPQLDKALEL